MSSRLLPNNATQLERVLADVLADDLNPPIRDLIDPERCPAEFLPYLAWSYSVDRWDVGWSDAVKRGVIAASFDVHLRKGTVAALRRVIEPLGYLIEIIEWWETEPPGPRGTFQLRIGVLDAGITEAMYREVERLIDDAKPLTRHLVGLDINLETRVPAFYGCALTDGDVLDIYPWQPADIDIHVSAYQAVTDHTIDILDVYLNG